MLKLKQLPLKQSSLIIITAINCSGCLNTGGNSNNPTNNVISQNLANIKQGKLAATAPATSAEDFAFSKNVRLGAGFDIYQNLPRPVGSENKAYMNTLLTTNGDLAYTVEAQSYKAWATMDGSFAENARSSKEAGSLAIGGGWGSYSASMKAAMEQSSAQFNQDFSQTYNFGVKIVNDIHFPISPTENNAPAAIENTRNAILSANPLINREIQQIIDSSTAVERANLITQFYANHGQYFVNSVTMGYLGNETMTLSQNSNEGKDASGMNFEGSFSTPFASGSGSYSKASTSAYKSTAWSESLAISMIPNNTSLNTLMQNVTSSFSSLLHLQGVINTASLSSMATQSVMNNSPQAPQLPQYDFQVDPQTKLETQATTKDKKTVTSLVNALDETLKAIYQIKQQGGDISSQLNKLNTLITADYTTGGTFDPQLHPDLYNTTQKLTATPDINYDDLITAINADYYVSKYGKINNLNQQIAAENQRVQNDGGNSVFSNWLRNIAYRTACTESRPVCATPSTWVASLTPETLEQYDQEWANRQTEASSINQQLVKASSKPKLKSADTSIKLFQNLKADPQYGDSEPAVLDFSLMPWSMVFPELAITPVNDYPTLMVYTILDSIDDYLNDYNYYRLTLKYANANNAMEDPYLGDMSIYNNALQTLINNLTSAIYSSNKNIVFNGNSYQIDNTSSVTELTTALKTYLANTLLYKSEWYQAIRPFKEKGLINPNGNLFVATSVVSNAKSFNSQMYMALIDKVNSQNGMTFSNYKQSISASLANQIIDGANSSTDKALHSITTALPLIYKFKLDRKYHIGELLLYNTAPAEWRSSSTRYTSNIYPALNSAAPTTPSFLAGSAYFFNIDLDTNVADASKMAIGYPFHYSYYNNFCERNPIYPYPDNFNGYAIGVGVEENVTDNALYLSAPCKVPYTTSIAQSLLLFPVNDDINRHVLEIPSAIKPSWATFYPDNRDNLASLKFALGL